MPPHTTSDGVARIRVGGKPDPQSRQGLSPSPGPHRRDRSGRVPISGSGSIPPFAQPHRGPTPSEAIWQTWTTEPDRGTRSDVRAGRYAGGLLLGSRPTLSRYVPRHELVFSRSRGRTGYDVRRDRVAAPRHSGGSQPARCLRVMPIGPSRFHQLEIPGRLVAREAVLNALDHRDSTCPSACTFPTSHRDHQPGVRGSPAQNPPTSTRAPEPAACGRPADDLVNRLGLGVDRIFEESLSLGKDLPRYEADECPRSTSLPTRRTPTLRVLSRTCGPGAGAPLMT